MRSPIVTEFLTLDGVVEHPAPPPGDPSPETGTFMYDELLASRRSRRPGPAR